MHNAGWFRYVSYDESKDRPTVDRALLGRVYAYARPHLFSVFIVLVTIVAVSLIELIPPLIYRDLIDTVLPQRDVGRLNLLALAMLTIPLLTGGLRVVQRRYSAQAGEGIIFDLRTAMYGHLQRMSLRFFTDTRAGEIVSRFNNDVVGAQNAITGTIPNIVTNVVTLVSTLVVMLTIEWRLALMSVAVLPLFLLPTRRVARLLRDIRREAMEGSADMSSIINETLTINGSILVKTFGRQKKESADFSRAAGVVRDVGIRRAQVGQLFFVGLSLAGTIGTALVYWAGGHMVLNGSITIGTIVAFVAYLARLYGPISALSNVQVDFATSMVSFERVFEYLDKPVEIQDKPDAVELAQVEGRIRFEDVTFTYRTRPHDDVFDDSEIEDWAIGVEESGDTEGDDENKALMRTQGRLYALDDLSFAIAPGQLVALVGPSGAGKTTISYLLPRLYDPTAGRITLDGHDLRDVTQLSLAHQIGMVTQETYLFHDTIRANLLYARPGASEDELVAAVRAANIDGMIDQLPDGLDTVVGERGYRLSGGEKQRLAIARVILKDPRILVLDEATSHLDSQSEALIQAALEPLFEGRTSLVIAHRLSTILKADKILVLQEGRLVEAGTHGELLPRGGLYADHFETQFRDEVAVRAALTGV